MHSRRVATRNATSRLNQEKPREVVFRAGGDFAIRPDVAPEYENPGAKVLTKPTDTVFASDPMFCFSFAGFYHVFLVVVDAAASGNCFVDTLSRFLCDRSRPRGC